MFFYFQKNATFQKLDTSKLIFGTSLTLKVETKFPPGVSLIRA